MTGRGTRMPSDLEEALHRHRNAAIEFEALAPSHKREHIAWIEEAKKPETRARHIRETIERLG